jgi:hypothetical protein
MRRIPTLLFYFVFVVLASIGLSGCGGSGASVAANPLNGMYSANYTAGPVARKPGEPVRPGSAGTITVTVGKNNMVTITIVDNVAGTYIGSGSMRSDKSFNYIYVKGPNGDTLQVEGTLAKSLLVPNVSGHVVGSVTFSYDAPLAVGNITTSLFANTYTGTTDMRNFDQWDTTVVIDPIGFIKVTIMMNGTPVVLRGLIYDDGHILLRPDDGEKTKYWGKGSAYVFADLQNLFVRVSISTVKDGNEKGMIRCQTPYGPG